MSTADDVEAWSREVGRLKGAASEAVPEIAQALIGYCADATSRETQPGGAPWPASKDGAGAMLTRAADVTEAVILKGAKQSAITLRITEKHYVLHDLGIANGAPRRGLLPDALNDEMAELIDEAIEAKRGGS